jgi:hypothetical protein
MRHTLALAFIRFVPQSTRGLCEVVHSAAVVDVTQESQDECETDDTAQCVVMAAICSRMGTVPYFGGVEASFDDREPDLVRSRLRVVEGSHTVSAGESLESAPVLNCIILHASAVFAMVLTWWYCRVAGEAQCPWQCGGQGFEPPQLHG